MYIFAVVGNAMAELHGFRDPRDHGAVHAAGEPGDVEPPTACGPRRHLKQQRVLHTDHQA